MSKNYVERYIRHFRDTFVDILIAGGGSIGTVMGIVLPSNHHIILLRRSFVANERSEHLVKITGILEIEKEMQIVDRDGLQIISNSLKLIFIATQAQDTLNVLQDIKPVVSQKTIFVSLQNGIRSEEMIRSMFPQNPIVLCSIWWGATLLDSYTVHYQNVGKTFYGISSSDEKSINALQVIRELFNAIPESQFNGIESMNIKHIQYQKLVINILAPLATLVKLPWRTAIEFQAIRKLAHVMFDEALSIISSTGNPIEELTALHITLASEKGYIPESEYQKITDIGKHKTSTWISTEKYGGKGSNIAFLLGELVIIAESHNMSHQVISRVKRKIESLEPNYDRLSLNEIEILTYQNKKN